MKSVSKDLKTEMAARKIIQEESSSEEEAIEDVKKVKNKTVHSTQNFQQAGFMPMMFGAESGQQLHLTDQQKIDFMNQAAAMQINVKENDSAQDIQN